jgi:hypothetical protein
VHKGRLVLKEPQAHKVLPVPKVLLARKVPLEHKELKERKAQQPRLSPFFLALFQ